MAENQYSSKELLDLLRKEREVNKKLIDELNLAKQGLSGNWQLNLETNQTIWDEGMHYILHIPEDESPDMKYSLLSRNTATQTRKPEWIDMQSRTSNAREQMLSDTTHMLTLILGTWTRRPVKRMRRMYSS